MPAVGVVVAHQHKLVEGCGLQIGHIEGKVHGGVVQDGPQVGLVGGVVEYAVHDAVHGHALPAQGHRTLPNVQDAQNQRRCIMD